ncbi:hypothetical protein A2715_05825 [Candidatus Woesebacteria bacterium RIFCSPHIGHO2_01_FULL_39_32]|uniref:Bacterial spore germination immunoglobulin-like domain-containing protein n=1 Tax=Candidatus Woesebacteria bacterium RIFCSPLOWO2_01_FULL_39_25 TaxID=1802521 RepID=A0A1F8BLX5_9BACT|nr:MAG: hypothetical protein A2124_00150 [Candidatus Woesebacteria bacterium GWB1_37_5]OGM25535.1 MAG: hypothetical protein A2715_05825 [Candidatus Woesebacteria bacterium RIFCSPHIGHO2_01_FULL_39_32]OGM36815.1 MAG: hypothetical protein A3F01_00300 [Candidatus Woesebacteria bacterium RIFCSPHIGHO2_12_FULL_38_11]OGM65066.1 MAG: hypothetical protein A2893_05435 [Candidatus Woesebacteria bacterium RIFCSPLOWO2_01_FULL_39_25]
MTRPLSVLLFSIPLIILILFVVQVVLIKSSKNSYYIIEPSPSIGRSQEVSDFESCASSGYPVLESYPRRCIANGNSFVEEIGNEIEKMDLIIVDDPRPKQEISSPLKLTGQARGNWYFEASFPVYLYDEEGNEIGTAIAQAQSDWMTEEFVPFSVNLEFDKPETLQGELVLQKANPSGLSENEDSLTIPVRFK